MKGARKPSRPNTSHTGWVSAIKHPEELDSTVPQLRYMKSRNMSLDGQTTNPLLVKKLPQSPLTKIKPTPLRITVPEDTSSESSTPRSVNSTSSLLRTAGVGNSVRRGKSAGHIRQSSLNPLTPSYSSSHIRATFKQHHSQSVGTPTYRSKQTPSNKNGAAWNVPETTPSSPTIDPRHQAILELTQLSIKDREQHLIDEMEQEKFLRSDPVLSKTKQKLDELLTFKPFEKDVTQYKKVVQLPFLGISLEVDLKDQLYRYYVPDESDMRPMSQSQINRIEMDENQHVQIDSSIVAPRSARALAEEVNLNTPESEPAMDDQTLYERLIDVREPFMHFLFNAKRRQKRRKEIVDAQIERANYVIELRKQEELEKMYKNMNDDALGRSEMTFHDEANTMA
jgi:hypothetical protein